MCGLQRDSAVSSNCFNRAAPLLRPSPGSSLGRAAWPSTVSRPLGQVVIILASLWCSLLQSWFTQGMRGKAGRQVSQSWHGLVDWLMLNSIHDWGHVPQPAGLSRTTNDQRKCLCINAKVLASHAPQIAAERQLTSGITGDSALSEHFFIQHTTPKT